MPEEIKHYFDEIPILVSDRLILRGVKASDASNIIDLAVYDGFFARNETDVLNILKKINANRAKGESIQWGICLKTNKEIIGLCSYHRGYPNNVGEIGYVLKEAYRGQGFMTEAVKLITNFGLNRLKLDNVVAYTDVTNITSISVLKRAGFNQASNDSGNLTFLKVHPQV